ncbi:MAG: hypothetical protein HGA54_03580, partial [Actinobacteria bacterium]|nr:hypothetical protein [Actinomycetota bacterium]
MLDVGALQTYVNRADNLRDALVIPPAAPLQLTPIGQGEYNANFAFEHPTTGHRMVLRLNF